MNYPKKVYALFPYDENGNIAGVYVGAAKSPERRMKGHRYSKDGLGKQDELHQLMRKNGYTYAVVDEIDHWINNHIEYDWLDFFVKKTNLKIFNNVVGVCDANWERINPKGEVL